MSESVKKKENNVIRPINSSTFECMRWCTLFFIFFGGFLSFGQSLQSFSIGENELANVDVYSVYYDDSTDVLFASTDRGLYSYRQNKFVQHRGDSRQIGNSLFQLKKDRRGRLFCCNLVGQIFQVHKDRIELFYELPRDSSVVQFRFYFDQQNNLVLNTLDKVMRVDSSGNESLLYSTWDFSLGRRSSNGAKLISQSSQVGDRIYFILRGRNKYLVYDGDSVQIEYLPRTHKTFEHPIFGINNVLYYVADERCWRLDGKEMSASLSISKVNSLYQLDASTVVTIGAFESFGYLFHEDPNNLIKRRYESNQFYSAVCKNKKGTLFLGTFKEGVFVVPNPRIQKYTTTKSLVGITVSEDNNVFTSNLQKEVQKNQEPPIEYTHYNLDNLFYLEGNYLFRNHPIHGTFYGDGDQHLWRGVWTNLKDVEEHINKIVLAIDHAGILVVLPSKQADINEGFAEKLSATNYRIHIPSRGKAVTFIDETNSVYFSTSAGLYKKEWNASEQEGIRFQNTTILANDLSHYEGLLIVATESSGLLFYDDTKYEYQISKQHGLKSNVVTKVERHNDLLFIQTIEGFQVFNLKKGKFIHLGISEGIMTDKVINFAHNREFLWFLEKNGFYHIPIQMLSDIPAPDNTGYFDFDSIVVKGINVLEQTETILSHDQNAIKFHFDFRNIEQKNETRILYKLVGLNNDWIEISANENNVHFLSLPPGEYTFKMKTVYRNVESEERTFPFTIRPPFWETGWFFTLCVLLIVGVTFLIFYLRYRSLRKKKETELQHRKMHLDILEAKLGTIRSQMNPHFIFNALNSIQALVLEENVSQSYDYIEMFGSLVRKTLNYSETDFIDLQDEINFLEIYLKLESLRFKKDFDYTITNDVEDHVLVPTLLVQPFLENAIHHGLLHKKGKKTLQVRFFEHKDTINCTVNDNGVGRAASKLINAKRLQAESFSLKAIKSRMSLMNQQEGKGFGYAIEDLFDDDGNAAGTRITIHFPKKQVF